MEDLQELLLSIPRPYIGFVILVFCISAICWLIYDVERLEHAQRPKNNRI